MSPSTDGKRIVYVQSGLPRTCSTWPAGAPRKVPVQIPSDDWRLQDRWINPSEYVQFVDVAGDGKAVVVGARGDVFHLALADKETLPRNLTRTPGVREDTPRLSPDGKRVAYFSDATGEYQLYVRDVATGRDDAGHDRPRPQGLPPALVARREEDPLRRQGLRALRGGPRHEEADEDRRVALSSTTTSSPGRSATTPGRPTAAGSRTRSPARTATTRSSSTTRSRVGRSSSPTTSTRTSTRASTSTGATSTSSPTGTTRSGWTPSRTTTSWPTRPG